VFHDLTGDEIESIVDLMIDRVREQMLSHGMSITIDADARTLLAQQGFDPALGARPLRRAIQRFVEDPLSEQILGGQWQPGDVVEVYVEDGETAFRKGEGVVAVAVQPRRSRRPRRRCRRPLPSEVPVRLAGGAAE